MEVDANEENELLEGLYIEEIQGSTRRNIQSDLLVNNTPVTFKLDTRAECNVMSMHLTSELTARIEPTSMLLKSFCGHQLDTVGKCVLDTKTNEATGSTPLEYFVIRDNVRPLLGLESCLALKLITLNDTVEQIGLSIEEVQQKPTILDEFTDVFEGLGCVEGEYNIKLKADSHPTIQPQRNVPLRLRDKLKATVDDLERKDIITKVEEPVDWVSNLVIVEKPNNTLRLCLDLPDLNQVIKREDFKPRALKRFQTHLMAARFSQSLTGQTVIGTKSFQKIFISLYFQLSFWQIPI